MTAQELYEEYEKWMQSIFHTLTTEDQSLVVSISLRLERMMWAEASLQDTIQDRAEEVKSLKSVIAERYRIPG